LPLHEQQTPADLCSGDGGQFAAGSRCDRTQTGLLSFDQARDLRALPQAVAGIDGLCGLKYLNTNEVLLMRPLSGFVVDEINS